jgi:hypothetical protein
VIFKKNQKLKQRLVYIFVDLTKKVLTSLLISRPPPGPSRCRFASRHPRRPTPEKSASPGKITL